METKSLIIMIFLLTGCIAVIAGIILYKCNFKRKNKQDIDSRHQVASKAIIDAANDAAKKEFIVCPYCGNAIKRGEKTCPSCGASITEVTYLSLSEEEARLYMKYVGQIAYQEVEKCGENFHCNIQTREILKKLFDASERDDVYETRLGKPLLIYERFCFLQFAKKISFEKDSERRRVIVCDACGGLVDIDCHHNCPNCGHPYGNDTEFHDAINVVITDSTVYMSSADQKKLADRLYETFEKWRKNLRTNIYNGNIDDIYPPGYNEISQYVKKEKERAAGNPSPQEKVGLTSGVMSIIAAFFCLAPYAATNNKWMFMLCIISPVLAIVSFISLRKPVKPPYSIISRNKKWVAYLAIACALIALFICGMIFVPSILK